jgi:hypothetical protein
VWSLAAAASTLGDSITYFAVGWSAAAYSPEAASLVLTAQSIPLCVLVLLGGAVADRWGIRRTMMTCDAAMILVLLAFLAHALRGPSLLGLGLLAAASGTAAALRRPADGAFPRLFATDAELTKALASVSLLLQVARTSGPALGGFLLGVGGLPLTTAVDLVTYALVLVVLLRVRPARAEVLRFSEPLLRGTVSAVRAARQTGVAPLLLAVILLGASVLPVVTLGVPLAGRDRGWSAPAAGAVAGCWTVGTFVVTALVARYGALGVRARTFGPGVGALGIALLALTRSPAQGALALVLLGVGTAVWTTTAMPLLVQATPDGMLARFQALLGFAQNLAVLVALPTLGLVAAAAGLRTSLLVLAALVAAAAALPLPDRPVNSEVPAPALGGTPEQPASSTGGLQRPVRKKTLC